MLRRSSNRANQPAQSGVSGQPDELTQESIARRDFLPSLSQCVRDNLIGLHKFFKSPEAHRDELQKLESALSNLGISAFDPTVCASSVTLRNEILLVLSCPTINGDEYTAADLKQVIEKHTKALPFLFQHPLITQTIGASIFAPTLYPVSELVPKVDEVAACVTELRKNPGDVTAGLSVFDGWQRLSVSSLLWGYGDQLGALSPVEYCRVAQLREHSVKLDALNVEKAREVINAALKRDAAHPLALFEILHPEVAAEIAGRVPLQSVVEWLRSEMQDVVKGLDESTRRSSRTAPDHISQELWNASNLYAAPLHRLYEAVQFFNLYIEKAPKGGAERVGVQNTALVPAEGAINEHASTGGTVAPLANKIFQADLSRVVASVMKELARCLETHESAVRFDRNLGLALMEILERTEINPEVDVKLSRGTYGPIFSYSDLLPGFERAIKAVDFESASNIRLLFRCAKQGHNIRDTIDAHIGESQSLVIESLQKEAIQLRTDLIGAVSKGSLEIPEELKVRFGVFRDKGVGVFLTEDSRNSPQGSGAFNDLVGIMGHLTRVLLAWDGSLENARNSGAVSRLWPHPCEGASIAATLVERFKLSPKLQKAILMGALPTKAVEESRLREEIQLAKLGLRTFMRVTAQEVRKASNEVPAGSGGAYELSPERRRAQLAHLLSDLGSEKKQLGEGPLKPGEVEQKLGERIVKSQEDSVESGGINREVPPLYRMLEEWLAGRFGKGDKRLSTLVSLCRKVVENPIKGKRAEEIRLEEMAFDVVVEATRIELRERVTEELANWVRDQVLPRFFTTYKLGQDLSRRRMAAVLAKILGSEFGASLCSDDGLRKALSQQLLNFSKTPRRVDQQERGWLKLNSSPEVGSWRHRMGI